MRTDGQTDMTKLIVAFRNCANSEDYSSTKSHPISEKASHYKDKLADFVHTNNKYVLWEP